jgi:hypothetical protein
MLKNFFPLSLIILQNKLTCLTLPKRKVKHLHVLQSPRLRCQTWLKILAQEKNLYSFDFNSLKMVQNRLLQ